MSSENISFNPENPEADETVTITVKVSNIGSDAAGNFNVRFYDFEDLIDTPQNVGGLAAGAEILVQVTTSFPEESFRLITVTLPIPGLISFLFQLTLK